MGANETGVSTHEIKSSKADCSPGQSSDHWEGQQEEEKAYQNAKSPMERLGFVINMKKSQTIKTQKMECLGFIINSVLMDIQVLPRKIEGDNAEV